MGHVGTVLIPIDESTYALIRYGAQLGGITEQEFVRAAVLAYRPVTAQEPVPNDPWDPLPVYGTYFKQRTDGEFVRATSRLTVTTGPLAGTTYPNPTAASRAVVRALNPERASGHTDGWRFWRIQTTGKPLETVRSRGRAAVAPAPADAPEVPEVPEGPEAAETAAAPGKEAPS